MMLTTFQVLLPGSKPSVLLLSDKGIEECNFLS